MKIFGREPALWVGLIEGVIAVLLTFTHLLNADQGAAILAVVTAAFGVYTAYVTKDSMLGVLTGLAKSGSILLVAFGLHFSPDQQNTIVALIPLVLGFIQRTQTSPLAVGTFNGASVLMPSNQVSSDQAAALLGDQPAPDAESKVDPLA
jgi:hypothetical protein